MVGNEKAHIQAYSGMWKGELTPGSLNSASGEREGKYNGKRNTLYFQYIMIRSVFKVEKAFSVMVHSTTGFRMMESFDHFQF